VVECPAAGGHNAPPRGPRRHNDRGEPVHGERDIADLSKIADLGLPFWVAGGAGHPDHLREARAAGAAGIQAGALFAYCDESGTSEPGLITAGDDLASLGRFLDGRSSYSAADVIEYLLGHDAPGSRSRHS